MRLGRGLLSGAIVGISLGAIGAPVAADPPPLRVAIETPSGGIVEGPVVAVEAQISDPTVQEARLFVNGATYHVPVDEGRVRQTIVAVPGNNRVGLVVARGHETARDSLTFRYTGEPVELVVLLTWPSRGEIVDLWVREPGGETCKWDHRATASGGHLLDFSSDAIGFGSQAYVLGEARPGRFRIKIHYWGNWTADDARTSWAYTELLTELDAIDAQIGSREARDPTRDLGAERARLVERLDAWALPGAPQTPVHAEVVLFPGTRHERRWRFDRVVDREGRLLGLGEVEIDEAAIVAARRDRS